MNPDIEDIYIRLMTRYETLIDDPSNERLFAILLDLINFCEDFPTASLAEYREFKELAMEHGPFERPPVRCIQ